MSSEFDNQLGLQGVDALDLPLAHTTTFEISRQILESGQFASPNPCPVYNEDLFYTFVARPVYRFPDTPNPVMGLAFAPVCFLLQPTCAEGAIRVPSSEVTVRGRKIKSDPYGNSAAVALIAEVPNRRIRHAISSDRQEISSEIELVLRACGTSIEYYSEEYGAGFRVLSPRGEFLLTGDPNIAARLDAGPLIFVVDVNRLWDRIPGWQGNLLTVPLHDLNLVLLSENPLRVARFIDFHLLRERIEWVAGEAIEVLRSGLRYSLLGTGYDGAQMEQAFQDPATVFDFARPRARRNYEIEISGFALVPSRFVGEAAGREAKISFSLVLRPTHESRVSRFTVSE